jgi:hypothetical protein
MRGFAGHESQGSIDAQEGTVRYVLEGSMCETLFQAPIDPDAWISKKKKKLEDKGKAGALVKTLAILQILWLVIQCGARLAQHLPLTTLEISTLAYVPCTILIYYLWWDKPYEINTPTYLNITLKKETRATSWVHPVKERVGLSRGSGEASRSEFGLSSFELGVHTAIDTTSTSKDTYGSSKLDQASDRTNDVLAASSPKDTESVAQVAPVAG